MIAEENSKPTIFSQQREEKKEPSKHKNHYTELQKRLDENTRGQNCRDFHLFAVGITAIVVVAEMQQLCIALIFRRPGKSLLFFFRAADAFLPIAHTHTYTQSSCGSLASGSRSRSSSTIISISTNHHHHITHNHITYHNLRFK
jgi:hypothetical protein